MNPANLEEIVSVVAQYQGPIWSERDGIDYPLRVSRLNGAVMLHCGHVSRTVNAKTPCKDQMINHLERVFRDATTAYRRDVSDYGEV